MTAAELRREVDDLVALLLEIGLAVRSNATIIDNQPPLRWITWVGQRGRLPRGGATVAEYRAILREGEYNCLLADGGILQISFALNGDDLVKHRFAWIPSPVLLDRRDANTNDVADLVDEGLLSAGINVVEDETDGEDLLLIAPVRFDYDRGAHREGHAACHLTFNRQSCRVPVFGPLSLGHFVRFVFRHFYPEQWGDNDRLREWSLQFGPRLVTQAQEAEIFIECRKQVSLIGKFKAATIGRR